MVLGALVLGAVLWFARGRASPLEFEDPITFTIVPSDRDDLACAGAAGELRCAFDEAGVRVDVPPDRLMQPFVTVSGRVVLLAGVFNRPAVADWLKRSAESGASPRAILNCQTANRSTATAVKVRWKADAPWQSQPELLAATAVDCSVP